MGYVINNLKKSSLSTLEEGLHMVLFHVDKKPPHIAMLCEGDYFSLSVNTSAIGEPIHGIFRTASLKSVPCIFIKIKASSLDQIYPALKNHYTNSPKPDTKLNTTCLTPICSFFQEFYGIQYNDVTLVFDLINKLHENSLIEEKSHLNLENQLQENQFTIPHYDMDSVKTRIENLKREKLTIYQKLD